MRKVIVLGIFLVLALTLWWRGPSADRLMKEEIKLMNDMADAMEKDGMTQMPAFEKRSKEIGNQLWNLKLSVEEKKKLNDKYKDEMVKASQRVGLAAIKAGMKDGMKKAKEGKGPESPE